MHETQVEHGVGGIVKSEHGSVAFSTRKIDMLTTYGRGPHVDLWKVH